MFLQRSQNYNFAANTLKWLLSATRAPKANKILGKEEEKEKDMRKEWAEEFRTHSPHKVMFLGLSPGTDLHLTASPA